MAEYKVRIWRRREPLLGPKNTLGKIERDEVSVEASSADRALRDVLNAEYAEGGKRLRVYVRIDSPNGTGHYGEGDYTLCNVAYEDDEERRAAERDEK